MTVSDTVKQETFAMVARAREEIEKINVSIGEVAVVGQRVLGVDAVVDDVVRSVRSAMLLAQSQLDQTESSGGIDGGGDGRGGLPPSVSIKDLITWWKYIEGVASSLKSQVAIGNSPLGGFLESNWKDEINPDSRQLYELAVSAQSDYFRDCESDAREFQKSLEELDAAIDDWWLTLLQVLSAVVNALLSIAAGIVAIVVGWETIIGLVAGILAILVGIASLISALLLFIDLSLIRAPSPPSLVCGDWRRPA